MKTQQIERDRDRREAERTDPPKCRAARSDKADCSTCRWWDSSPFDERFLGLCRRNPPSVKTLWDDDSEERDSWPMTEPVEWCGEHTPNKKNGGR